MYSHLIKAIILIKIAIKKYNLDKEVKNYEIGMNNKDDCHFGIHRQKFISCNYKAI